MSLYSFYVLWEVEIISIGFKVEGGMPLPFLLLLFYSARWKWTHTEWHLLQGIFRRQYQRSLEQGPFLLLIAATRVVGKSPLPATVGLEHFQNHPHCHWASTANTKNTLIAKSGAPGWRIHRGTVFVLEGRLVLTHSRISPKWLQTKNVLKKYQAPSVRIHFERISVKILFSGQSIFWGSFFQHLSAAHSWRKTRRWWLQS